jgi:hypothetical protein
MSGANWRTAALMMFGIVLSEHTRCYEQVFEFIGKLAASSAAYFVLSYEGVRILALRDAAGSRFFREGWPKTFAPLDKSG